MQSKPAEHRASMTWAQRLKGVFNIGIETCQGATCSIDSGKHADRFVEWCNDCFTFFEESGEAPEISFFNRLRE